MYIYIYIQFSITLQLLVNIQYSILQWICLPYPLLNVEMEHDRSVGAKVPLAVQHQDIAVPGKMQKKCVRVLTLCGFFGSNCSTILRGIAKKIRVTQRT